jgi:pilus assembly protein CpaE
MNDALRLFTNTFIRKGETSVALVSPRRELLDRLRTGLKGDKRFALATIHGTLSQVDAHLGAGSRPAVLLADIQDDLTSAIGSIEKLRLSGFSGPIITLSDTLDEPSLRGLLRFNVTDWLPADAKTEDVIEACQRALTTKKQSDRGNQAKCLAFIPAAGGVGTTTLAIQTAFLLAKEKKNFDGTCLVDLNLETGALADYLDLQPLLNLQTIADEPGRLDERLLAVMLARHPSGVAVLAAPRSPTECRIIPGDVVASVLSVVSETFSHMVLDMPPVWQPWTNDILAASDEIYVVTEFTVPALRKAQEIVQAMASRLHDGPPVKVIINKFHQQIFGGGLRKADAAALLGEHLGGFVPEEQELVNEAINRGEPVGSASRSNRVTRELSRIILKG